MLFYLEKSKYLPPSDPQYSPCRLKTKSGWKCKWIPCDRYSLQPWLQAEGVAGGWVSLSDQWAVSPRSSCDYRRFKEHSSHTLDRCPAITLSQRKEVGIGFVNSCIFLEKKIRLAYHLHTKVRWQDSLHQYVSPGAAGFPTGMTAVDHFTHSSQD